MSPGPSTLSLLTIAGYAVFSGLGMSYMGSVGWAEHLVQLAGAGVIGAYCARLDMRGA